MPTAYNQGQPIHYVEIGSGEALVLLHAFMNDHQIWIDMGYTRSLRNYRLILIDHRGYGKSFKPHISDAYELHHRVADVLAVLDKLRVKQAHIMGYSLGARIALRFGIMASERTNSLIIGGMSPYGRNPGYLNKRLSNLKDGMQTVVDQYEQQYGPLPKKVRQRILANDNKALIADTLASKDWKTMEKEFDSIDMPVLLYAGDQDDYYIGVKQAAEELPNAEIQTLVGANHQSAYVRKNDIMPAILTFLAKHRS